MSLKAALDDAQEKLDKFLAEEGWTMRSQKDHYPITFIFRKGVAPEKQECDGQTRLEDEPLDLGGAVPEIHIIFQEETEFVMHVPDDQRIDDKFLNKLKNLTREVHRLYLLHWFSNKESRFERLFMPMFDVVDGKASVGLLYKSYRP